MIGAYESTFGVRDSGVGPGSRKDNRAIMALDELYGGPATGPIEPLRPLSGFPLSPRTRLDRGCPTIE
jgi:hypothetical protein